MACGIVVASAALDIVFEVTSAALKNALFETAVPVKPPKFEIKSAAAFRIAVFRAGEVVFNVVFSMELLEIAVRSDVIILSNDLVS